MKKEITIRRILGVAGSCLVINDYRVAGPKPWGGGKIIETYTIPYDNVAGHFVDGKCQISLVNKSFYINGKLLCGPQVDSSDNMQQIRPWTVTEADFIHATGTLE